MLTSRLLQFWRSHLLWNLQNEKDVQLHFPVLCLKCRGVDDGTVWQWNNFFLEVANCNKLIFTEQKDQTLKLLHYFRNTLELFAEHFFPEIFSSLILARAETLCCQTSKDVISFCLHPSELFSREIHLYLHLFISHSSCLGSGCWGALSIRHQICHVHHISNGPEAIYYRL